MGSPVCPIVTYLYMEEVERKVLASLHGATPSHWFRYVDDTWVKLQAHEIEAFTDHNDTVDSNIKFTCEYVNDRVLAFLDCAVNLEAGSCPKVEAYRKTTHTDQYLLFDSHHPLQHKLGVIRTLNHKAESVPTKKEGKKNKKNTSEKPFLLVDT